MGFNLGFNLGLTWFSTQVRLGLRRGLHTDLTPGFCINSSHRLNHRRYTLSSQAAVIPPKKLYYTPECHLHSLPYEIGEVARSAGGVTFQFVPLCHNTTSRIWLLLHPTSCIHATVHYCAGETNYVLNFLKQVTFYYGPNYSIPIHKLK